MSNTPRPVKIVLGVCGVALGLYFIQLGWREAWRELRLRREGKVATAKVLQTRITPASRRTRESFDVLYEFTAAPETGSVQTRYTRSDLTGRDNLWSSLEQGAWERARETGHLKVLYDASDPASNRPVESGAMPLGDQVAGIVLGLAIAGLGAWGVVGGLKAGRTT